MDDFRSEQKKMCPDFLSKAGRPYGCSCCRDIGNLNHFKKYSRKLAKSRFREQTRKEIKRELHTCKE